MTIILVFGTSITYGAWDKEGGWVQRLREYVDKNYIKNKGKEYFVYNLGISGDTSKDILERCEFETQQRLKLLDTNERVIILISVGVNDAIINNKTKEYHIPLDIYAQNIKKIIKISEKYADRIVFVGNKPTDDSKLDPIPWLKECSYKAEFVEQYDKKAADICKEKNIQFIDVYNQFKKIKEYKKLLHDGVHPTTEGHKHIFEIVKKELRKTGVIE